jgi:hypothetical protein
MNTAIKLNVPLKMSVTTFLKLHYPFNDINRQTIINYLSSGKLSGIKEVGKWFVYVDESGNPFQAPEKKTNANANNIAQAILKKHKG